MNHKKIRVSVCEESRSSCDYDLGVDHATFGLCGVYECDTGRGDSLSWSRLVLSRFFDSLIVDRMMGDFFSP